MARRRTYSAVELAEVAAGLKMLLAEVEAGRLTADSGVIARLEGAVAALEALAREGVPEAPGR
ncbi:MAG TPA: hypothetical protein VFZ97_06730 [Acidimicrobiales bacterium]